jgi:Tfp pilus assembly protein FimT
MVLVLALLVAIGAVAWPAINGSFSGARLRSAADRIRTAWSEARLEAMRTGTIHEFRYQEGARKFRVRAWTAESLATVDVASPQASLTQDPLEPQGDFEAAFSQDTLPDDITFEVGTQNIDQRATLTAQAAGANVGAETMLSAPILFYPDGTTTDAVLHLKNDDNRYIRLALRGLTGISRASRLLTVDELAGR